MDKATVILEQREVYQDFMSSLYSNQSPEVTETLAPSDTHLVVSMFLASWRKLPASKKSALVVNARMDAIWIAIMKKHRAS